MRNLSLILWVLLLMDGVFGVDKVKQVSVSVMKGDSVTLHTDVTELQSDKIEWMSEDNVIIAQIANNKISIDDVSEGRLELDHQTGSLTIRNITENRIYNLDIGGRIQISKRFNVTVHDVVESVSVVEGDTVTLHTGVTKIQADDQILWKFGDQDTLINGLNGPVDVIWSNIDQNNQTGDITIRNIRNDQDKHYKVEIITSSMVLHRKFHIKFSDEMKTVSVKKEDSIILRTGVIDIREYYQILWKFEDERMAEITKGTNKFSLYNSANGRFSGRLHPDHQTGSLTISDSQTTDSGDYHLNMISSSHTIQRTISVTVKGLSSAVIAVIALCVALVVVVAVAVGVAICHMQHVKRSRGVV
ncbi:hypothetical protein PO909_027969 [Leuciscus waleckii]